MNRRDGFTLIEIVVVLGIIAVMSGALTTMAIQVVSARREQATREELKALKEAIIGNAEETEHGEEFTFGFVGDMGGIPTTLDELMTIIGTPTAGWNGPYIRERSGGNIEDPYGTEYNYEVAANGSTNAAGVEYLATITSAGHDCIFDTVNNPSVDDLSVELLAREVYADVRGYVKDIQGVGVASIDVTINYPQYGVLISSTDITDTNGLYEFSGIPIGDHTTTISPKLLYRHGTAKTTTGSRNNVRFEIENFYGADIDIETIKVENKYYKPAYYEDITMGTETVFTYTTHEIYGTDTVITTGVRPGDLDTAYITNKIISPSTMSGEPFLTRVQVGRVEAPDIVVSRIAAGGSLTIEIVGYEDAKTGNATVVDMTGIPFTVTFGDNNFNEYEVSFIPSGEF